MEILNLNSLKQAREEAGLTQTDVERSLGFRKLTIRDYETGRLKLPVEQAIRMSRLYQVSLDYLVGNTETSLSTQKSKVLANFESLFLGNGFSVMFLDPILRAFLEEYSDQYFKYSLFELLTLEDSENSKKEIVTEIVKHLFSLASADKKVSDEETACMRYLLKEFHITNKYKEISVLSNDEYLPQAMPRIFKRIELRHFIIWLLFFFSFSDGKMTFQELQYIEKCAEYLKINRSNFLFIKEKFFKENS